jgi:hypothetical protein
LGDGTYTKNQWIGLRENSQDNTIFNGKNPGIRFRFSHLNQTIEKDDKPVDVGGTPCLIKVNYPLVMSK